MISPTERRWINALKKLAKTQPKSLRLCMTDTSVKACKIGFSAMDIAEDTNLDVQCGTYLADQHDGQGYGENSNK